MWALHAGYLAEEVIPAVPAPVLAQAWRSPPPASRSISAGRTGAAGTGHPPAGTIGLLGTDQQSHAGLRTVFLSREESLDRGVLTLRKD
jgi:hypothetical protein